MCLSIQSLVECLTKVNHDDKSALSQQCRRVVHTRQVLADKDIRLNPRLEKNCKNDITNLCFKSIQQFGQTQLENVDSGISLDGVIIQCLKDRVEFYDNFKNIKSFNRAYIVVNFIVDHFPTKVYYFRTNIKYLLS